MGKMLRAEGSTYNVPRGHHEVINAITEGAGDCPDQPGHTHDVDVVYSARLRVRDAFCLRCGQTLPIPPRVAATPTRHWAEGVRRWTGDTTHEPVYPGRDRRAA